MGESIDICSCEYEKGKSKPSSIESKEIRSMARYKLCGTKSEIKEYF